MKSSRWQIILGSVLVALAAIVYVIHYLIFRDAHHIFIYLIGDIAFVFFEVLLVTLIIHRLLTEREKRSRLEKLNMVIGTFFSEVGTELLDFFSNSDPDLENIRAELVVEKDWSEEDFEKVDKKLRNYSYGVEIGRLSLDDLGQFLGLKRDFLLRLLENPNLLEHESFTELLRAVFHLTEELANRENLKGLPESDHQHLAGDVKRAYSRLVHEWLDYMKHLKDNYPYLFSLAMRTNPFDREASPIVK
jgi:hypothetical protein